MATISNWDVTQLVKVVQDIITARTSEDFTRLTTQEFVAKRVSVTEDIAFSKYPRFRKVGGTGEPAFENSWVAWGAPYHDPGFYKDPLGFIHLRGIIKLGTVGSTAFTLPPGMRPSSTVLHPVISNNAIGRLDIAADGTVKPVSPSNNTWVSLDGVQFKSA